jgi:hypothetical protein
MSHPPLTPAGRGELIVFKAPVGFKAELKRVALANGTLPSVLARELVLRGVAELAQQQDQAEQARGVGAEDRRTPDSGPSDSRS